MYAALSQADSEPVQAVLQRVAEQRIAFLTGLYADLGLPPQRARLLARLAYSTYIGLMRITAEAPAAPLSTEDLAHSPTKRPAPCCPRPGNQQVTPGTGDVAVSQARLAHRPMTRRMPGRAARTRGRKVSARLCA